MMNVTETNKLIKSHAEKPLIETIPCIPGIWVNGKYLWMQDSTEKIIYDEQLIMKVNMEQIHSRICFSTFFVSNHSSQAKEITLLAMHHLPSTSPDNVTFVSPAENHIFHHTNGRIFLINGQDHNSCKSQSTVVPLWNAYTDLIWSSIDKGSLRYQPLVKGPAASITAKKLIIGPHATCRMNTWAIGGSSKNELLEIEKALLKNILAFPFEK